MPAELRVVPNPSDPASERGVEEMLAGLRKGDRRAQAAFFDRYVDRVERILLRVMGPDSELEDLLHECFVQALASLHTFRGEANQLRGWLGAVTVRTARNQIRRRQVRRRVGLRAPEEFQDVASPVDPSLQVALQQAQTIIDELPSEERIAFGLRFIDGMELREVAECMGRSLSTIKRVLSRARSSFETRAAEDPVLREWLRSQEIS